MLSPTEVRRRLDVELVRRGIVGSRAEAALAIRTGRVTVGGRPASKASTLVAPDEPIVVSAPPRPFVSRGGEKLDAALARFGVEVRGRVALDAGAGTGGFTDCLLRRGAARVVAVDVGYGQLDWRLREDPRVVLLERTNVRHLGPEDLPVTPDLVTADLSFISLRLVLPALRRCGAPEADFVLLVKPQFEVGRDRVGRGGVVTDPGAWRDALAGVAEAAWGLGLLPRGVAPSPLPGPAGNVEFFLHAAGGSPPEGGSPEGQPPGLDGAIAEALELRSGWRERARRGPGVGGRAR
jgi:23S rRNA (cytidine1920-2'-O)/16S rRNA (cytidine1409-2'-O)-methyltransferase